MCSFISSNGYNKGFTSRLKFNGFFTSHSYYLIWVFNRLDGNIKVKILKRKKKFLWNDGAIHMIKLKSNPKINKIYFRDMLKNNKVQYSNLPKLMELN